MDRPIETNSEPIPLDDPRLLPEAYCGDMPAATFRLKIGEQPTEKIKEALRACGACALKEDCLNYALVEQIDEDILGGTTPAERITMLEERSQVSHLQPKPTTKQSADERWLQQQMTVLDLAQQGKKDREIGEALGVGQHEVKALLRALRKRGVELPDRIKIRREAQLARPRPIKTPKRSAQLPKPVRLQGTASRSAVRRRGNPRNYATLDSDDSEEFTASMANRPVGSVRPKEEPALDLTEVFLGQMGNYPLLSLEQEKELIRQVAAGREAEEEIEWCHEIYLWSEEVQAATASLVPVALIAKKALNDLIEANVRLVVAVARSYYGQPLLDFVQEGVLGLYRGLEKFDPDKGFRLSTYVTWWIAQSIGRFIDRYGRTIRLPEGVLEEVEKVNKAVANLEEQDQSVTPETIATALGDGWKADRVTYLLRVSQPILSLDEILGYTEYTEDNEAVRLSDTIEGYMNTTAFGATIDRQDTLEHERAALLLDLLEDGAAKQALQLRCGWDDNGSERSIEGVGMEMDINAEEAEALIKSAAIMIRQRITALARERLTREERAQVGRYNLKALAGLALWDFEKSAAAN